VIREVRELVGVRVQLEGLVAERDAQIQAILERVRSLEGAVATRESELQHTLAEMHAVRTRLEGEVLRRQGWRWWLRLPFVRLGWLTA
jgi:hypothetical protein